MAVRVSSAAIPQRKCSRPGILTRTILRYLWIPFGDKCIVQAIHRIASIMMMYLRCAFASECRRVNAALAVLTLGLSDSGIQLRADPPPNDLCQTAEMVPADGPFPWISSLVLDVT